MNKVQALEIVTQAINIALAGGAFKNTKDVVVIHQAVEVLSESLPKQSEVSQKHELPTSPGPVKESK